MKRIALLHLGAAYKPEVFAYKDFFEVNGFSVDLFKAYQASKIRAYDVEWHFMGFDFHSRQASIKIHEYSSVSNPPFSQLKRLTKRVLNVKPNLRIFGSEFVAGAYNFSDGIPCNFREAAGIGEGFFKKDLSNEPEFDFAYCGTMEKVRQVDRLLAAFVQNFPLERRLLMIGEPTLALYNRYKSRSNIIFTGRMNYDDIPKMLSRVSYGLNFIPDIFPLNRQVPLKLLEYCALGLKIITTDYAWVRAFADRRGARFFFLKPDLTNWKEESLLKYQFITPEVNDLSWKEIMERSQLLPTISRLLS